MSVRTFPSNSTKPCLNLSSVKSTQNSIEVESNAKISKSCHNYQYVERVSRKTNASQFQKQDQIQNKNECESIWVLRDNFEQKIKTVQIILGKKVEKWCTTPHF